MVDRRARMVVLWPCFMKMVLYNLSLSWNHYGWDTASNIIFVDQLTGTGFSCTTDPSDIRNDENGVSNDFLQGFSIGNGLTQPDIQFKAYTDFALENKLIQKSDYDSINELIPVCEQAIKDCGNSRWVNALAWSGKKKATGEAPTVPFVVEGKKAGKLKGSQWFKAVVTPDTQPIYHQLQTAMSNGLEYVCPDVNQCF
ncbi:hypothetical protein D5086_017500 [Populus alba]|uniref:Uncharacterized protein n=1 Tax=Populus alba TaxID=43335 RepID=A0ACC4BM47_POPAL